MVIPPEKTPTSPPMGFHSRSSTGTGVCMSTDGPHARNHALGRFSSHGSNDCVRGRGCQRREVAGTDFVYCGPELLLGYMGIERPRGVGSLEVARALRQRSRRGALGRGAGGPDRGRRY